MRICILLLIIGALLFGSRYVEMPLARGIGWTRERIGNWAYLVWGAITLLGMALIWIL